MGQNDHINEIEEDRKDFLRQLVEMGMLQGTALGITKKVIAEGEDVLSEDQKFVFQRYVLDVFVIRECSRMGCEIPWSEMLMAHENGGLCGYCQYMADKVMGE